MQLYKLVANVTRPNADACMKYLQRFPLEAQSQFANQVLHPTYSRRKESGLMTCGLFTKWCTDNQYLVSPDVE